MDENGMKEVEEELALFLEMRKRENDLSSLNLLPISDEFDDSPGSKFKSSSILKIVTSPLSRKTDDDDDDLLNSENDKNDYEWLLTPPGSPLFSSLEMESPKTVPSQTGSPKARSKAFKSRLENLQVEPASRSNIVSRHQISSPGLNPSSPGTRRPSSSGGPGSATSRPATPTGRTIVHPSPRTSRPTTPSSKAPTGRTSVPPSPKTSRPTTPSSKAPTGCTSIPPSPKTSRPTTPSKAPSACTNIPPSPKTSTPTTPSWKASPHSSKPMVPTSRSSAPSTRSHTLAAKPSTPSAKSSTLAVRSSTPARSSIPARSSAPSTRSSTPAARSSIPSGRSSSLAPRSSTTFAKSSSLTPRSLTPSARSSTLAAKTSAPSLRSSTPAARPITPTSRSISRSATPTRRSSTLSTVSRVAVPAGRSSSVTRSGSATRNPVPSGGSSVMKSRPRKSSEKPGLLVDAASNGRMSMPERPVSTSKGRPGAPGARPSSGEIGSNGRLRQQSSSPLRGRLPHGVTNRNSVDATRRAHSNGSDNVSPVLIGTKMVERVINMRKLAPPKQDERTTNPGRKSTLSQDSGFGRTLSKKSLDMALRHMDIRRSIPGKLRTSATNVPASSIYSVRSGRQGSNRTASVSDSPFTTSSNASSESFSNDTNFLEGSEVEDEHHASDRAGF